MKIPFFKRKSALGARAGNPHFASRDAARARRLSVLVFLPPLFAALFIGAVAGLDAPVLLVLVAGALFAMLATFVINANIFLQVMFVMTFVVQGSAQYFGGIRTATWVAAGMGGLFMLRVLMDFVLQRRSRRTAGNVRAEGLGVMFATLVFLACYGASVALNRPPLAHLVSSVKSTLLMFGVFATFLWFYWKTPQIERLWNIAIGVLLVQLPVVVYQHFFVASQRANGHDSVVGTFGGVPLWGGLSSMLALFTITVMCYSMARWNHGLMKGWQTLGICAVSLVIIMLGEVKASFLWLPLCTFLVLRKRIMKNLFSLAVYSMMAAVLLGGMYYTYKTLYWAEQPFRHRTAAQEEKERFYFFDTRNVNYRTGEVSRGASLALWVRDQRTDLAHRLLGYGPGASKAAGPLGGGGTVAKRFAPLSVAATAMAMLLWDVGLVGALAYTSIIVTAIWAGRRYIRRAEGGPREMAIVQTSTAIMVVFFTMLVYNRTQLDEPTVQLLFMFLLGCIVQMTRFPRLPEDAQGAPQAAAPAARRPGVYSPARPALQGYR